MTATRTAGANAVVSGIFIDPSGAAPALTPPGTITPPTNPAASILGPIYGIYDVSVSGSPGQPITVALTNSAGSVTTSGSFTATVSLMLGHLVIVSWGSSTTSGVTGYNVYRSTVSGGPYTPVGKGFTWTALGFADGTVASGQTYYYVVTAVQGANESAYSNQAIVVVPTL